MTKEEINWNKKCSFDVTDSDFEYDDDVKKDRETVLKLLKETSGKIHIDLIGMWDIMRILQEEREQALSEKEKENKQIWREYEKKVGILKDKVLEQREQISELQAEKKEMEKSYDCTVKRLKKNSKRRCSV